MNFLLFFLVILLANIIQGITGFAGTILAMPFSIMLVGFSQSKPVLNVLAILSGIYVLSGNRSSVNKRELKKIVLWMLPGMLAGFLIKDRLAGNEIWLQRALGVFVIGLAVFKILSPYIKKESQGEGPLYTALLPAAGVIHGIFVSGGPLLIGYLTGRIKDKAGFRATISTVWILLNSLILMDDLRTGLWSTNLLKVLIAAIPFLLGGMWIGSKLYKTMSQQLFMKITYVLLLISGVSLLVK